MEKDKDKKGRTVVETQETSNSLHKAENKQEKDGTLKIEDTPVKKSHSVDPASTNNVNASPSNNNNNKENSLLGKKRKEDQEEE